MYSIPSNPIFWNLNFSPFFQMERYDAFCLIVNYYPCDVSFVQKSACFFDFFTVFSHDVCSSMLSSCLCVTSKKENSSSLVFSSHIFQFVLEECDDVDDFVKIRISSCLKASISPTAVDEQETLKNLGLGYTMMVCNSGY